MTVQQSPFLRQQRNFPNDNIQALTVEIDRSYIDIATKVNNRTIGTYAVNFPIVTGEEWFLSGQAKKQQTLRQVYSFTSTANIAHGIITTQITGFTRLYGTFTDGTNTYGLVAGSNVAIAGQIGFYITPTNIVFTVGGGSPALMSGLIVLEWLSKTNP